jgi:hypothetical protein
MENHRRRGGRLIRCHIFKFIAITTSPPPPPKAPPRQRRPPLSSAAPTSPLNLSMAASSRLRPHPPPTPTLSFGARSAASAAVRRGSGGSASLPASHRLLRRGSPRRHRLRLDLRREGGEEPPPPASPLNRPRLSRWEEIESLGAGSSGGLVAFAGKKIAMGKS